MRQLWSAYGLRRRLRRLHDVKVKYAGPLKMLQNYASFELKNLKVSIHNRGHPKFVS
jgi:hypothetical protein